MENLGAMAYSRYTGFREITDRDVLELHCIVICTQSKHLLFSVGIRRCYSAAGVNSGFMKVRNLISSRSHYKNVIPKFHTVLTLIIKQGHLTTGHFTAL